MGWIQDLVDPRSASGKSSTATAGSTTRSCAAPMASTARAAARGIYVKDGIVTWEMQGLDYPLLEYGLPPYEPRGCQRGISASWYLYSPIRVKYPYVRGALLDSGAKRSRACDPVEAWGSIVEDAKSGARPARPRQGRFPPRQLGRSLGVVAAASLYTAQK